MNVQKNYNFAIEVDGIHQLLIQKVTTPTVGFQEHKHGIGGDLPDVKTPGKKQVGDMVCEGIVDAVTSDGKLWRKLQKQEGAKYTRIIENGYLVELDNTGNEKGRWEIVDMWLKEIAGSEYVTGEDGAANMIRKATFSVYDFVRV